MKRSDYAATIYKRELKALEDRNRALGQELERCLQLTAPAVASVAKDIPAIEQLIHTLFDVVVAADPRKSTEIDGDRVKSSAGSPDEGAPTRQARQRVVRVNRQVAHLSERIELEMSGERVRVDLPRCSQRGCRKRVRDVLARYCPACGAPLPGKEDGDE